MLLDDHFRLMHNAILQLEAFINDHSQAGISRNFGFVMTFAGLIGVPAGSYISQTIRRTIPNADPIVSGVTLLLSVPGKADAASHKGHTTIFLT